MCIQAWGPRSALGCQRRLPNGCAIQTLNCATSGRQGGPVKNLFGEAPLRILVIAGLLVAIFLAFLAIRILLVPFVAALFVAYLFEPVIVAMQRRGMDRGRAFLLLLGLTLFGIVVILSLMPQWLRLEALGGSSAAFAQRMTQQFGALERWVDTRLPFLQSTQIGD